MFLVYIEQEYKRGRTVFCAHIAMAATAMVRRVLLLLLLYMTFLDI